MAKIHEPTELRATQTRRIIFIRPFRYTNNINTCTRIYTLYRVIRAYHLINALNVVLFNSILIKTKRKTFSNDQCKYYSVRLRDTSMETFRLAKGEARRWAPNEKRLLCYVNLIFGKMSTIEICTQMINNSKSWVFVFSAIRSRDKTGKINTRCEQVFQHL